MPFPLLISLSESLLELCSALPVAGPLGPPCPAPAGWQQGCCPPGCARPLLLGV